VLGASDGLAEADEDRLRGGALELLLGHPGAANRELAAVEAARRPGDVFLPLRPAELDSQRKLELVDDLIDESLRRTYEPGDARAALREVEQRSPDTASAIVVAGPETSWSGGPAPEFVTDVVRVGPASAQDAALRSLAETSGGSFERVGQNALQAQVAHYDALQHCESPVTPIIDGTRRNPFEMSELATPLVPGYDLNAHAVSPEDTPYVDMVLTWTSADTELQPEVLAVEELDDGDGNARFGPRDLLRAATGETVERDNIRLTGSAGETFVVLRVDFRHEDENGEAPQAMAARHRRHRIHYGGSRAYGALAAGGAEQAYVQFFARRAR
jgi:hypothetical protein